MGKVKIALLATGAFALGLFAQVDVAKAALLYCSQPMAPLTYLSKPNKPFCASTRSCSEWEVRSYQREVESYFDDLRRYAREVDDYYNDASSYISCMAELD